MTDDQRTRVLALYDAAQVAGQTTPQQASDWLNAAQVTTRPESERPRLPAGIMDADRFKEMILDGMEYIDGMEEGPVKQKWRFRRETFLSSRTINLDAPKVQGWFAEGVIDGVFSQAFLNNLIAGDPNWDPNVYGPSRWIQEFGWTPFAFPSGETVAGRCYPELIELAQAGG